MNNNQKQLEHEIEKLINEMHIVYINFKIISSQMKDAEAISPLADELQRIINHIDNDLRKFIELSDNSMNNDKNIGNNTNMINKHIYQVGKQLKEENYISKEKIDDFEKYLKKYVKKDN